MAEVRIGRDVEYEQVMTSIRHYHDYRTRLFNFSIVVSGGILTLTSGREATVLQTSLLAGLALLVTIASLLAEIRIARLIGAYSAAARELDIKLGLEAIGRAHQQSMGRGTGSAFQAMYVVISIGWIMRLVLIRP